MSGFKIDIRTNAAQVSGNLNRFERRQVPFAMAKAINNTLFDIRPAMIQAWQFTFPGAKNKSFARAAFRVSKASKHEPVGAVYDALKTDFVQRQAIGGRKQPKGRALAIPQYRSGAVRRTRWGPAQKQKASAIIGNSKDYFSGKPKGHPGAPRGIYKRLPKTRRSNGGLRLMFVYKRDAFVRQQFDGYEVAENVTSRRFPIHMQKALAHAIATAKIR